MKIGQPKYEGSNKNYFSFGKDKNHFILRILPPMGELAESGKWSIYHRVEFGHVGTDGKMKPFLSPRVVNYDGMVEVESESHVRRESMKAQLKAAQDSGDKALEEKCNNMLRKYNQDKKHYMNVVDLQGNVGLFKIAHRGFTALKKAIDDLRNEGVDPIGIDNGRFFVFSRSGTGTDTLYTVTEYKQKQKMTGPDGNEVAVDVPFPHSLTETLMGKLETDAFDLANVYPSISAEEESRIINEGATAVDEILGKKKSVKKTENTTTSDSSASLPNADTSVNMAAHVGSAPSDTLNQEPVQTGYVQEQPAAQATSTTDVAGMSDEDFFKKIESGNI